MKKTIKIKNLDCANCAAKLEDKINGFIDDSQRLNNQLVDYQNVIMQIEELLNENYD